MYQYPYGDTQQLNLDWILTKIKELEAGSGNIDMQAIANALISATYNSTTQYRRYDYCFYNGKLYRCLSDTTGAFNPADWQEALIGDDIPILTRLINAIDAAAIMDVKFDTSGTNGKIQQKYNEQYHDVVEVDYDPVQSSKRPLSSNAGYELNGAVTAIENSIAIVSNNNTHVAIAKGQYVYIKNHGTLAEGLYQALAAIPQNDALSLTNVTDISGGGLNTFVGKKLVPILDTMFSSTNPTLMEAGHTYPWNSGTLPVENYLGFVWIFYPTSTAITSQKILLDEVGTARSSHYSLATSQNGQVRILHNIVDAHYEFTSSDSTVYLHRIYGIRYEIN